MDSTSARSMTTDFESAEFCGEYVRAGIGCARPVSVARHVRQVQTAVRRPVWPVAPQITPRPVLMPTLASSNRDEPSSTVGPFSQ